MRQSSRSSRQESAGCRTDVGERVEKAERIIAFLRQLYPVKTADNVAADLRCSPETVAKMIERVACPNAVTFGRMILAYGPAFLVAVFPSAPKWLDEAHRRERQEALKAEQRRIAAQLAALEPLT